MPRKLILADIVSGPAAERLRVHTAERTNLLENLNRSFENDQRVRAAWLWGSFQRGEQDDLSDLDLWLLVQDEAVESFCDVLTDYCQAAGAVVFAGENKHNAPADGGYLGALVAGTHGLHHLDIYWQPVSKIDVPPGSVLIDRTAEDSQPKQPNAPLKRPEPDPNAVRIAFVWLMLSITAKYLARDPNSDMALLQYPKNAFQETAIELGLDNLIAQTNWQAPEDPKGKVETLRQIAGQTAILEQDHQTPAYPCLMRYFDLVEAIIRTA